MNPETIANNARKSISNYCINECNAFCCRKGHLILNPEEMLLTVGNQNQLLTDTGFLVELEDKDFVLDLGSSISCPSLKNNLCLIHKNPKRNPACKEFPIFITDKKVRFSKRCLAVKDNKLYPYIHEFKELGFIIGLS